MAGAGRPAAERAGDAGPAGGRRDRLAPAGGRALAEPAGRLAAWRTVYGWFRRWLELGLFDALLRDVARRRRRKGGGGRADAGHRRHAGGEVHRRRGPRGYDAAKGVVGRKRVALVDAEGHWLAVAVVPASVQDRDTLEALDAGKAAGPPCGRGSTTARSRPSAAANGRTGTGCATAWSPATRRPRASSCSRAAGWSSAASAGCPTGAASPGTAPAGSTSRPPSRLRRHPLRLPGAAQPDAVRAPAW